MPNALVVGLEYFCFEGDGLWTSPDADLVTLAKKELAILGLAAEVRCYNVLVRQKKAYPVYDLGYRENVELIRSRAGRDISDPAPGWPQRHAHVQQPRPCHDDGNADRQEYYCRRTCV